MNIWNFMFKISVSNNNMMPRNTLLPRSRCLTSELLLIGDKNLTLVFNMRKLHKYAAWTVFFGIFSVIPSMSKLDGNTPKLAIKRNPELSCFAQNVNRLMRKKCHLWGTGEILLFSFVRFRHLNTLRSTMTMTISFWASLPSIHCR